MNPDDIQLESMGKLFAYEKMARDIDGIKDMDHLRNVAKAFCKLYYKQQEVVGKIGI